MSYTFLDEASNSGPATRAGTPYFVLTIALLVVGIVAWAVVFTTDSADSEVLACSSVTTPNPEGLGQEISHAELQKVELISPKKVQVRVFNANGEAGQAGETAASLTDLGFQPAPGESIGNDPIFTGQDLNCRGQIRFGTQGRAAAATLALTTACVEFIQDDRKDATVDLSFGTLYDNTPPSKAARDILRQLSRGAEVDKTALDTLHSQPC